MSEVQSNLHRFLSEIQKQKIRQSKKLRSVAETMLERQNILNLKILVLLDISGSISFSEYNAFLQQLDKIRGLSKVKVMEVDTMICTMYDYTPSTNLKKVLSMKGGGGTNFLTAYKDAVRCNPDAIILLTDGADGNNLKDTGLPTGIILSSNGYSNYDWMTPLGKIAKEADTP